MPAARARRCAASTASGRRCRNRARRGESLCHAHRDRDRGDLPSPGAAPAPPKPVCDICFEAIEPGEEHTLWCCRRYTSYHRACIQRWIDLQRTCPNCRRAQVSVVRKDRGGGWWLWVPVALYLLAVCR